MVYLVIFFIHLLIHGLFMHAIYRKDKLPVAKNAYCIVTVNL